MSTENESAGMILSAAKEVKHVNFENQMRTDQSSENSHTLNGCQMHRVTLLNRQMLSSLAGDQ